MRKIAFLILCLYPVLLGACYSPPKITPIASLNGNYILDPAHTSIVWTIKHAGLSNYTASFNSVSGILNFNPIKPQESHVDISIDPLSVNTGDGEFNQTIAQDSRYFDGNTYPKITFTSSDIILTSENTGQITGALSFRGVTKPITLSTIFNGAGKSFGHKGKTLGFSATTKFNRSDFGLNHLIAFGIGDEVNITIETEFNEKH